VEPTELHDLTDALINKLCPDMPDSIRSCFDEMVEQGTYHRHERDCKAYLEFCTAGQLSMWSKETQSGNR